MSRKRRTAVESTKPALSISDTDYVPFLASIKQRIASARVRAARAISAELILMYWDIGRAITQKQRDAGWGDAVVERLTADLRAAFPNTRGFSSSGVWRMRQLYVEYSSPEFLAQAVREIDQAGLDPFVSSSMTPAADSSDDRPSIGIILCAKKDDVEVEFALRTKGNPIGVAAYQLQHELPNDMKGRLPTAEQLEGAVRTVLAQEERAA